MIVHDLRQSVDFYTEVLKMTVHQQIGDTAILGSVDGILLELKENKAAKQYPQATGLYHFAIIYPNERELAEAVAWLFTLNYPNSPTDHGYSKTTYLTDPDGNTIELYIRTPERAVFTVNDSGELAVRYTDGRIGNGRDTLDLEELFATLDKDTSRLDAPLSNGVAMGHVHLYTGNIDEMLVFYRDVIGLGEGIMLKEFQMGDVSLSEVEFHVIAFNQWKGDILPPPQPNIGMHHYTLIVPDERAYADLRMRIEKAKIEMTSHQDGYFIKDPAGLSFYITRNDSKMKLVNTDSN